MAKIIGSSNIVLFLAMSTTCAFADGSLLFNGKNLEGWTFAVSRGEGDAKPVEEVWIVQNGLLVSTGACSGFLKHKSDFENYVLTLEWRSMQPNGNGTSVSGTGSAFVHTSNEMGRFNRPKSVEIGLFSDTGSIYFRDDDTSEDKQWAFRAPDFAEDAKKDMGEWNHLKVICRGTHLTVFVNGTPVNQVDGLTQTRGRIALQSLRAFSPSLSYYRNIRVQPLSSASAQEEKNAAARLAKFKALVVKEKMAEKAMRHGEAQKEKMLAEAFEQEWATIEVTSDIDFTTDTRKLPYPADISELEFDARFGDIEMKSTSPLTVLSKFYRTEMAKRGWNEIEKERDEESIEVTFKHGQATVALNLDQNPNQVRISLDCRGLSFEGTNDPAGLVTMGLPQPRAYLFLQKEFQLPANVRDLEFDGGNRCLFKCELGIQEAFDSMGQQLRAKGYRETRRPIVKKNRRYTEFTKGKVEVGVNIFTHEGGSRSILTFDEN